MIEKTTKGELDIVLVWGEGNGTPHVRRVADLSISWIGRPDWHGKQDTALDTLPIPLIAFEPPCVFRAARIAALDEAGIAWRLVFTSPSLSGLWAAAEAGLGITLRTIISMPNTLAALNFKATGLPQLPTVPLTLYLTEAEPNMAVRRLTEIVLNTIHDEIQHSHAGPTAL